MNVRHLMGPAVVAAAVFSGGLMSAAYAQRPDRGDRAEQRERGDRERGDRGARGRGDRGDRGGPGRFGGGAGGPGGFGFGGPGGMMMGRGGSDMMLVMLLGREEVREELDLKPEQIEGLRKLAERQRPERPDFRNADRDALARMREQIAERAKETREQVEEILSLDQMDRLEQIALQVRGPRALADEDVAEKLELSPGTVETLNKEIEEHSAKMRDEIRELAQRRDFEAMQDKNRQMQQELEKALVSHLTSEQKTEYEKLKGKPFELSGGLFGRGGGPGGPGAFGGRGGAGAPGGGRPGGFRGRDGGDDAGRGRRGGAEGRGDANRDRT